MFITKITFNNIRSFTNKVTIDLNHNRKNIDVELNESKLFKRNKIVYTPIISIGGPNAAGKSSTLEAIYIIFDIFNILLFYKIFNPQITGLVQRIFFEIFVKIDEDFENIINNSLKNSIKRNFFGFKNHNKDQDCIKKFSNWFQKNDYKNISETSIKTFINEIFNLKKNFHIQSKWNTIKSYPECSSLVKFEIYDEDVGFFELIANDIYADGKTSDVSLKIEFKDKNKRHSTDKNYFCLLNKTLDKLFEYGENIFVYGLVHEYQSVYELNRIFNTLNFLINNVGKEKTLRLIRICDESVEDIGINSNVINNQVVNLFTKNGVKNPFFLSEGTKKFLNIAHMLIYMPKKSGLILIDELDNCMHNKLVDFFKIFVQQLSLKNDIQLFYTSHNPICLVSRVSAKQIYLINKFENEISFEKVSTNINKNNSTLKMLIEEKIGSHPSNSEILSLVTDLIYDTGDKNV